jgi:pimeloyl-ACP methyl ester carboxylesterase
VQEASQFIEALLDAAGVQRAALVGHSWGSLIALETAGRLKTASSHIALVGTAFPMKVSPALLERSLKEPAKRLR